MILYDSAQFVDTVGTSCQLVPWKAIDKLAACNYGHLDFWTMT